MKLFMKFLKTLCVTILLYPPALIVTYINTGGHVDNWFWLVVLIIDVLIGMLHFLLKDFELIKRIKNKKLKNKNTNN